jgi:hypothetical protein
MFSNILRSMMKCGSSTKTAYATLAKPRGTRLRANSRVRFPDAGSSAKYQPPSKAYERLGSNRAS